MYIIGRYCSQVTSVHWYFLEHFLELSYYFFSQRRNVRFWTILHFFYIWNSLIIVTLTPSMFKVLPAIFVIRYKFPKYTLVFMWDVVTKNKYGRAIFWNSPIFRTARFRPIALICNYSNFTCDDFSILFMTLKHNASTTASKRI